MEPFYKKPLNSSRSFSIDGLRDIFVNQTDKDVFIVMAEVDQVSGVPLAGTSEGPYIMFFEPLKSEEEVVEFLDILLKDNY